jgi:hypothetical protein
MHHVNYSQENAIGATTSSDDELLKVRGVMNNLRFSL